MQTERPWQSRTMWIALISAVAGIATVFGFDLGLTPDKQVELAGAFLIFVGFINGVLRVVSTKKVTLNAPEDEPPTGV